MACFLQLGPPPKALESPQCYQPGTKPSTRDLTGTLHIQSTTRAVGNPDWFLPETKDTMAWGRDRRLGRSRDFRKSTAGTVQVSKLRLSLSGHGGWERESQHSRVPQISARKLCVLIILLRNRHRKQTGRSNKETTMRSTQRTKET